MYLYRLVYLILRQERRDQENIAVQTVHVLYEMSY